MAYRSKLTICRRVAVICVLFLVFYKVLRLGRNGGSDLHRGYATQNSGIKSDLALGETNRTRTGTSKGSVVQATDQDLYNGGNDMQKSQIYNSGPVKHIAFLKVHKVASGIMQDLFLRFGIEHDLVFVLPQHGTSLPMSIGKPISSRAIPPPRNRTYDILCSHIRYNRSEFEKTLPSDSVYIATVRDPFRQFISSIHYYHRHFMLNIAKQKPILKFLQAPNEYTRIITGNEKVSNFYNSMAWDFGFPFQLYVQPDEKQIQKYLRKLDKEFDLVIVAEYFEESLILMRRLLNWDMRYILYVSKHVQKRPEPALAVGKEEEDLYRKWCLLDYALFDFFKRKFLKRWQEAVSNSDAMAELQYFREMKTKVNEYCQKQLKPPLFIKSSEWHAGFTVDKQYCKNRRYGEVKQINKVRNKQLQAARHGN